MLKIFGFLILFVYLLFLYILTCIRACGYYLPLVFMLGPAQLYVGTQETVESQGLYFTQQKVILTLYSPMGVCL